MLHIEPGLTALLGGGGKSTLLRALAQECAAQGRVVVATSTKMRPADWCPLLLDPSLDEVQSTLKEHPLVCVGTLQEPTGKLDAPRLAFEELAFLADYVLVEADGAKGLPCKAHASHEPVIPACANQSINVLGIDCIGKPIAETCHRPDLYAQLASVQTEDVLTPELAARVLNTEGFGQRLLINKVERPKDWEAARAIAARMNIPVVAGSLWKGDFQCL